MNATFPDRNFRKHSSSAQYQAGPFRSRVTVTWWERNLLNIHFLMKQIDQLPRLCSTQVLQCGEAVCQQQVHDVV